MKCTQLHYISNDQNSKSIGSFIDLGILLVSPHCLQHATQWIHAHSARRMNWKLGGFICIRLWLFCVLDFRPSITCRKGRRNICYKCIWYQHGMPDIISHPKGWCKVCIWTLKIFQIINFKCQLKSTLMSTKYSEKMTGDLYCSRPMMLSPQYESESVILSIASSVASMQARLSLCDWY